MEAKSCALNNIKHVPLHFVFLRFIPLIFFIFTPTFFFNLLMRFFVPNFSFTPLFVPPLFFAIFFFLPPLFFQFFRRDDDDDDPKNCSKITQNLLNCSLGYIYKHIGTRKFLTKALWVYSHLKSGFLFLQKVT